jgi:fructose-1,6-bisphosphatase/inositol monophosphatase family enzyme
MIDYNVRLWDLSACRVISEEAGGGFTWIKKAPTPQGFWTYGAVFGKKNLVDKITSEFFSESVIPQSCSRKEDEGHP